ncbi:MAG: MarR family transcriptional regulator [Lachnospiraceae bacterium]|nr:MarR family transcriptional regulator [Lachnospiraceae bacterium]
MDYNSMIQNSKVEFGQMLPGTFLIGLLSAFENRFQTVADSFFEEITWKQFFAIICINLCKESPTINELSEIMASSHQNVKQILIKLEKKGFVKMMVDERDKRKQRIVLTKKCDDFCKRNDQESAIRMNQMFEDISEEQLITTIHTIIQMEKNLRKH